MSVKGLFSKDLNLLLKIISKSENTKKIGLTSQIQSAPQSIFCLKMRLWSAKLTLFPDMDNIFLHDKT